MILQLTPKVGVGNIGKTKGFFIMKLSLDDKIEIVRLYEKKLGYGAIATKLKNQSNFYNNQQDISNYI